jgi:hypothetical protein
MPITPNDITLQKIREKAKDTNDDRFRLQINRKNPNSYLNTKICTLDGATVEMISAPETWLPQLYGGGHYMISVIHVSEIPMATTIGDGITVQINGLPKDTDPMILDLVKAADWTGPRTLVWPTEKQLIEQRKNYIAEISTPPAGGDGNGPHAAKHGTNPNSPPPVSPSYDPRVEAARAALENEKLAWERQRRELDEATRKAELERIEAKHKAELAELKVMIGSSAKAGPNMLEVITAIGTTITPLIGEVIKSNAETRKEVAHRDEKAREENNKLLMLILEKKNDESPNLKIMSSFADAFQGLNGMAFEMMHRMREEVFGPPESNTVMVIKELGKALIEMGGKAGPKLKAAPQPAQPAQPAQLPAKTKTKQVALSGDPVARISAMIKAKLDPEIVVDAFFASLAEKPMQEALAEVNGDPQALLFNALGDWIPSNMEYLQTLGTVMTQKGDEIGLFAKTSDQGQATPQEQSGSEDPEEDQEDDPTDEEEVAA